MGGVWFCCGFCFVHCIVVDEFFGEFCRFFYDWMVGGVIVELVVGFFLVCNY